MTRLATLLALLASFVATPHEREPTRGAGRSVFGFGLLTRWPVTGESTVGRYFFAPKFGVNAGITLRIVAGTSTKLAIPIIADLSGGAGQDIANLATNLNWGPTRLTFDSVRAGTFGAFGATTGTAPTGFITANETNGTGSTTSFTLATAYFTTSATSGSTTVLPTPTSVTGQFGTDLTSITKGRGVDVCVSGATGKWGDATGDNNVNIVDAQQVARFSVGLSVTNLAALQNSGDVTADGLVNIVDAQQIARFSVGLSAAARVNTTFFNAPTVASITGTPANAALQIGQTSQATATPKDGTNASILGCVAVAWSSLTPAIATVDSTGFITAVANGAVTIRATAGGLNFDIPVQVGTAAAATVTVALGSSSLTGNNTTTATATVRDQFNNVIAGAPVTWSSLTPLVARITGGGAVQALGAGTSAIRATSGAVSGSSTLTVTAAPGQFNIDVRVVGSMTPSQLAAFTNGANRWMQIIRGDVPNVTLNQTLAACGFPAITVNETVDDLIIYASIAAIDGPGNILAQAGPCIYRGGTAFTIIGVMTFDIADVPSMEANGTFPGVVLHEMGHIMGVGTFWTNLGLLTDGGLADPIFTGTNALWAFPNIGFGSYAGRPVPVENTGGSGTRDAHWRESVLDRELMTGYVEPGGVPMPLTALTIGSLLDEGHVVDFSQADPSSQLFSALARQGVTLPKIPIVEGVMPAPIAVDATGRPVPALPSRLRRP